MKNTSAYPRWNSQNPEIPFKNDKMLSAVWWSDATDVDWVRLPSQFTAPMKIVRYERTQSINVHIKSDVDNLTYITTIWNILDIIESYKIENNQIPEMTWQFYKQGSSYLIKVVKK